MRTKRPGFTLIEILTVMSIIIILITILIPALTRVKQYARKVKQVAQFKSIRVALDMFYDDWEQYPDSDEKDEDNQDYCGAMKLCEALMGQDLLGFHPFSNFRRDGRDTSGGVELYPDRNIPTAALFQENLKMRKGPYLELENINVHTIEDIYGKGKGGVFDEDEERLYVLCDVYSRVRLTKSGKRTGMPILYYKADTTKEQHDVSAPDDPENIYDYKDNDELVQLGMPWDKTGAAHPMDSRGIDDSRGEPSDPAKFYEPTLDPHFGNPDRPNLPERPRRATSYILISAGPDGEYGTPDDVFNF